MRGHMAIPLSRAWNSWSALPAEMVYLPLGLRITPMLYSSRARRTSLIEPRSDMVRFGRHTIRNRFVELETELAGTKLRLAAGAQQDPFRIRGEWSAGALGEWGTRFWLTLAIHADGGEVVRYDAASGAAIVSVDRRYLAVVTDPAPIQVTGHADLDALRRDFEENGYFHTASRAEAAPVLGLRFNMEMMRDGAYGAAIADSEALAVEGARQALAQRLEAPPAIHRGQSAGALDAVRDVVGWSTLWDPVNRRPYTVVSRIWNLGRFAVWYNDQTFAALLAGMFDATLARENMAVALAGATPQGNVACIVTSNDAWVDRSQPPHGSLIAWLLYLRTGERSIVEASYEALSRNQRWWRRHRDPDGTGLVSCGTSDVGEGLYKGSVFAARNETGMDNSATHDEAEYDPATRTLSTYDLGLNCALALDAEMLAEMASLLGRADDAAAFRELAERSRDLIRTVLWDEERGIFANRQRKGGFVSSVSPTSFYPLLCGAASAEQAARLLAHLGDPTKFAGDWVLPNASRDDPAFAENVYWRGRIWPNVNFMVWLGLRRYGEFAAAEKLAGQSLDLFMKNWRDERIAAENYNAVTGEAMDQGDTDPFYIWSALLPMMAVEECCGFDPWNGWTLRNDGNDVEIGPVLSPAGEARFTVCDGLARLTLADRAFGFDMIGRITDFRWSDSCVSCLIVVENPGGRIVLSGLEAADIVEARLDGIRLDCAAGTDGVELTLPLDGKGGGQLSVWLQPRR